MSTRIRFSYCAGEITEQVKQPRTAIVSIANNFLIPNVGVDEKIRAAGGPTLTRDIEKRREKDLKKLVYYETGEAIFTGSGTIDVKGVIHVVLQAIMNDSILHMLEIQSRHLLRKGFNSIMRTAQAEGIDRLVIPMIFPELIAKSDAIQIAFHALSEICRQKCEVVFVSSDSQFDAIFAKTLELHNQRSSNPFSVLDSVKFKAANDSQQNFLARFHLPSNDFLKNQVENNRTFSIDGTGTNENIPDSDAVCVIVDEKLRYKYRRCDSIITTLATRVQSPIAGRVEYEPGFTFVMHSQSTVCKDVIVVVTKKIPRHTQANNNFVQCALVNMYTAIIRCASVHHFKCLMMPIVTPSGICTDTSIALAIYTCMELQDTRFDVRRIILYHENPQVVSRIFFMLGCHRNRCIPSESFRSLCIQCLPTFPCEMSALQRLPAMIHMMWDIVPTNLSSGSITDYVPLSVNAVTQSTSTQSTRIRIVRADIATVPAVNGCVVNAANGRLQFGDGVARALGDAAGPETKKECAALIARYQAAGKAPLPGGSATITGCGRMTHVSKMIHTVGPILSQGQHPSNEDVYRLISAYQQTLRIAGLFQLETLVVPFISTGVYAFPQLLGMTVALYATLTELPAHNIRELIFVHKSDRTVRSFVSLMGNRTELVFSTRGEADALIRLCCASFVPSIIRDPAKRKIDTELQEIWELTKRLVIQKTTPTVPHAPPQRTISTGDQAVKRRVTPQPPESHKRAPPQDSSDEEIDNAMLQENQDPAALKRLKAKLRQQAHRTQESQESIAKRKGSDAQRHRVKRPSQRDLQMRDEERSEPHKQRRRSQTSSVERNINIQERASRSPSLEIIDAPEDSETDQAAETKEARRKRLDDDKKRHAVARANESQNKTDDRLEKQKERQAAARGNESQDKTDERLEKQKERQATARGNESQDKTDERLEKQKERQSTARGNESQDKTDERLEKQKERQATARGNESQDKTDERLEKQKERQATARGNESQDKTDERLEKQKERQATARGNESQDKTDERLEKQKERQATARGNESQDKTDERLERDKQQHAITRANQSRAERADRRNKDKEKHKATRENATESQKTKHRILDVLRKRSERAKYTPAQRAAIRKRDAQSKFWHRHDPSRPLRKPGSRIITDAEKNYPYSLPEYYHLGPRSICKYCNALTYTGNCCKAGTVHVRLPSEPPKFLQDLLVGDSAKAKHFRANIMSYNRSFQMASTSSERTHTAHSNPFMKINGNIQYQMGGINQPPGTSLALFNQVYPFEPKEACAVRMKNWNAKNLDKDIVQELSTFLHENNFLAKQFYMIAKIEKALEDEGKPVPQRLMILRAPTREELKGNHPGTTTRPMHELNSALFRTDETGAAPANGVWVLKEGRRMQQLSYASPLTDPLCYPLLFVYGEETFRYAQDQLFPKGTTRQEAGFVYHDAEATVVVEEEQVDYDEDPFGEVSSLTRMQIDRDVAYLDRHAMTDPDPKLNQHQTRTWIKEATIKVTSRSVADRHDYDRMFDDELLYEPRREVNSDQRDDNQSAEYLSSSDDGEISSLAQEEEVSLDEVEEIGNDKGKMLPAEDEEDDSLDEIEDIGRHVQINSIVTSASTDNTHRKSNRTIRCVPKFVPEMNPDEELVHEANPDEEPVHEANDSQENYVEVPDDDVVFDQHSVLDEDEVTVKDTSRVNVSRRQYYLYILQERVRSDDSNEQIFNPCGANGHILGQFFIIDMSLRVVKQRNDYARGKLAELRGSTARSFMMAVLEQRALKQGLRVGYSFKLSRTCPGSVAYYRQKFTNSIVMISKLGHPDLFITMTGNTNWEENKSNFGKNSDWQSNPMLLCEVFHKKMQQLLHDIVHKELFGKVACYSYSIEFQKVCVKD